MTTALSGPRSRPLDIDGLRQAVLDIQRQVAYLRRRRDSGKKSRTTCLSEIASAVAAFSNRCDLPGGYSDPDDPWACDALGLTRADFEELRDGDYPVPPGEPVKANGARL